mgnify:CR=1 FL=1
MVSFAEVINRALTGPYYSEKDYNLKLFVPKLRETVKKYEIKYDPENVIPLNDDLAERVFKAGVELYSNVGTYCVDSHRVIQFTEAEIREALATAPSAPIFGEGKDAKALVARKPESNIPPWCFLGACGVAVSSEEIFESIIRGYGGIPFADSITTPSLATLDGTQVRAGSPLEILACIKAVTLTREGLRKAGRPGLPIMNSIATAVSDQAKIAGSQFGLRPSDGWLIGSMAELKVDYERLNEIAYVTSLGGHVVAETSPILGGYCGGPEGVAVTNVAYHIQSILVFRGSCQDSFPIHIRTSCNTDKETMWAISVSNQAISSNSHFPLLTIVILSSGPETEMEFYEANQYKITDVVSGSSIESPGGAKNACIDHISPMTPQWASEVAYAVIGMKRDEANEIVNRLLSKYENNLDNPPEGKKYQECYNIKTLEPSREYVALYKKAKKELTGYGLKFRY